MKRILFVKSSLNGSRSVSTELAGELIAELRDRHAGSTATILDLDALSLPHLDALEFKSWSVPAEDRTPEQTELATRSDRLIEQLLDHDTLVLAVPMYNLNVPSTLKAWIDRVVRAGKTFRYTDQGPEGLVRGMEAYAVYARGGQYSGTPLDTQTAYVNAILGLIGIENVKPVFAEGLAMGVERRNLSFDGARSDILSLVDQTRLEVRYASA